MKRSKTTTIKEYYTKSGEKRYYFKIYIGKDPLTGKPKYTTRRFKKEKEAKVELARMKYEIQNGTYCKERIETFQDVYNLWIKQYERTVEESTFEKTYRIFKNHILPALGKYIISKINYEICQQKANEWTDTVQNARQIKSYAAQVLDYAIKLGYIKTNPFNLVKITKKGKRIEDEERMENFYSKEELIMFLHCLKKESNLKIYTFFRLLAYTGMRKGEALALTWNDINFTKKEIRISKALSNGKNNRLYIKTTKTGSSRTISIDNETLDILKKWKIQQKEDLHILGFNPIKTNQLVFSNNKNNFLQPSKTVYWLEQILKKYKLPKITTHGFRHTHCSLLFEAGVGMKEVQQRLGHADIKTTMNVYAHISNKGKIVAVNKFEEYMKAV